MSATQTSYGNRILLYGIALLLAAIMIWGLMYNAQFLEYDMNYGDLLIAFLISLAIVIWMMLIGYFSPGFFKACWWISLAFLLVASPFTVIVVAMNYAAVFGSKLQL